MFKKTRKFMTDIGHHHLLDEFFNEHGIAHTVTFKGKTSVVYMTRMSRREFDAFCAYLLDLRKLNSYPLLVRSA